MILKTDENGAVVVQEGKPVYVSPTGEDIAVDIGALHKSIGSLKDEAKQYRLKAKGYKASIDLFGDVENLEDYKTQADAAISKVANFKEKDIKDADKLREIKAEWDLTAKGSFDKLTGTITEKDKTITSKDAQIRKLLVSSSFAQSPFFNGADPKTILPADIAEAMFGSLFRIEDDSNGTPVLTAYTQAGLPISSMADPSKNAGFEESMSIILDAYEGKSRILPASHAGTGAAGAGTTGTLNPTAKLQEKHAAALKSGNVALAIALKNQIAAAE